MRPVLGGDEMNKCPIRKPFFSFDLGAHELIIDHGRYLTGIFPSHNQRDVISSSSSIEFRTCVLYRGL